LVEVSEDMKAFGKVYVDSCRSLMEKADGFMVEAKFHLESLHRDLFGTSDFIAWKEGEWLEAVDLKYGLGHRVSIRNNLQLQYYALGAVQSVGQGLIPPVIRTTIVQPRIGEDCISTAAYDALEMMDFAYNLQEAAQRTDDPNAPLNAGAWCQFCAAAFKCPALLAAALALHPNSWDAEDKEDEGAYMAALLNAADQARFFTRRIDERALNLAQGGATIPGYVLTQKRAMRKINAPEAAAKDLLALGVKNEDLWETDFKSPAELEKVFRLKYKPNMKPLKEALETHISRASSGFRLDPVREPGQLANGVAEYGFAEIPEAEF